jgi:hypothetical protein
MRQQKNTRDRYIQLVETFITALESGRSGSELEDIRKEIRLLSAELNHGHSGENSTQNHDFLPLQRNLDENSAVDR